VLAAVSFCHSGHIAALGGAFTASLGTGFAVGQMVGVFFALGSAGIADLGTEQHKLFREIGPAGIKPTAEGADVGTIAAKPDAVSQVVVLAVAVAQHEAVRYAVLAGFDTIEASGWMAVFALHFHNC
jgi:hypothetical protein